MSQSDIGILVIAAVIVVAIIAVALQRKKGGSYKVPPAPARKFFVTCFGCYGDQVADMLTSVNMHWEEFWQGKSRSFEKVLADIKADNKPTCLGVSQWLWKGDQGSRTLYPEDNLRALFNKLREEGTLSLVKWISPCDEPNLPGNEDQKALIPQAMELIKKVAAEYPELTGYRRMCTQTTIRDYCHLDQFDDHAFDHYDAEADIFAPGGDFDRLAKQLPRPNEQLIWPCVGVYSDPKFRSPQMPENYINAANGRPLVGGLILFLHSPPVDQEPNMVGMKDMPEVLAAWKQAGRLVCQVT